ncbi:MAG TPA: hypothetical protein VGK85_07875, partial [Myxococcaceae bacterium]
KMSFLVRTDAKEYGPFVFLATAYDFSGKSARATDVFSSAEEVAMPFDFEKLAEVVVALLISSSVLLVAAAIAWRLAVKPTLQALESRTARAGGDPVLSRRVTELEEEVRAFKARMAALPEGNPARLPGADAPWRGTKEKA